jgi:hypothetical protein
MGVTPPKLINRIKQREQLQELLDHKIVGGSQHSGNEIKPFIGIEYYGIGGIGKTRFLEEAKIQCRERKLPFAIIDFFVPLSQNPENAFLEILVRICDQYDHYISMIAARNVLPDSFHLKDSQQHAALINKYRQNLAQAFQDVPLILMLDSTESCSDELFNMLGNELIAPLVNEGLVQQVILFLAGRGPRMVESRWPRSFLRNTHSEHLDPLSYDDTENYLETLPTKVSYRPATKAIHAITNGHPYSTETLATLLDDLNIKPAQVEHNRLRMAEQLYKEVIQRYILAGAPEWVLPLIELACVPRHFDASTLAALESNFNAALYPSTEVQYYIARIVDFQRCPLNLVFVGKGTPAYELESTLRNLMHTALAIIDPGKTAAVHNYNIRLLRDKLGAGIPPSPATSVEILYHIASAQAIQQEEANQAMIEELQSLLKLQFQPRESRYPSEVRLLRDLLAQDRDIVEVIGGSQVQNLLKIIDDYISPPSAAYSYNLSTLIIDYHPPAEYRTSWFSPQQMVIADEIVNTRLMYTLEEWRAEPEKCGRTAFRSYLPTNAQNHFKQNRNWALQWITDWADIPWEMLHDGNDFLCLNRPMARKPKTMRVPQECLPRAADQPLSALVVGDPIGDLPSAIKEAQQVKDLLVRSNFNVTCLIGPEEISAQKFATLIANQPFDLIHYAGHAQMHPSKPKLSGLKFKDGPLYAEEWERILCSAAFIFLNACEAGRGKSRAFPGFRGKLIEGIAISALLGGASGCLGPMWMVLDDEAAVFAIEFYNQLLLRKPIGEATRLARLKIQPRSLDTALSWILYGDPIKTLF